jgi:hypothetical protein
VCRRRHCRLTSTSISTADLSQIEFFLQTGYYIKQIDSKNHHGLESAKLYVICYNTNLGATNTAQQMAFLSDLQKIKAIGGSVYILGHHPDITQRLVPDSYSSIVKGLFSGHIHTAESTNSQLFTQIPAISQGATTTGFFIGKISQASNYEIS